MPSPRSHGPVRSRLPPFDRTGDAGRATRNLAAPSDDFAAIVTSAPEFADAGREVRLGRVQDAQSAARALLAAWAHLAVLWSFAFAQPLLDLLGDTPEFFVARGNTRADILAAGAARLRARPAHRPGRARGARGSGAPRVRRALHLAF